MLTEYLMVAEVLRPQGVRGELKLRPITNDITRFADLDHVYLEEKGVYRKTGFHAVRADGEFVFGTLEGVTDRNAAELLRGKFLYVDRANAVELDENEDFICDLIGCEGTDDRGRSLGKLVDVMQPGGNDVYIFHGPMGEVLVPALRFVFLEVNTAEKRIVMSAKALDEVAVFNED